MDDQLSLNTKAVIAEKFSEISKYKSIDKITVTELVEACKISRQAFYYHFHDMMDLVMWLSQQRIHSVLELSRQTNNIEEALKVIVSFFSDHHEMIQKRLNAHMYRQLEALIYQDIRTFLRGIAKHTDHTAAQADFEAALDFCAGGIYTGLLTYTGKSAETDAWLAHKLNQLICGELSLL